MYKNFSAILPYLTTDKKIQGKLILAQLKIQHKFKILNNWKRFILLVFPDSSNCVVFTANCTAISHATFPYFIWANNTLAACPTPCRLQTSNTDVQVDTRLRRISQTHASRRLRPVAISAYLAQSHAMVQNSSGRQVVWCRQTAALEQAACFTAVIWQSLLIQKTVENVFVCQRLGCSA